MGAVCWAMSQQSKGKRRGQTTGRLVEVPSGKAPPGHVVNPLGMPLDGKGRDQGRGHPSGRVQGSGRYSPQTRSRAMQTGILAVDSMIPIGRGQRELIIGDRQTGKTAIAVDAILNQKGKGHRLHLRCRGPEGLHGGQRLQETLEKHGAMDYTIIVAATASDSARCSTSLRWPVLQWASTSSTTARTASPRSENRSSRAYRLR